MKRNQYIRLAILLLLPSFLFTACRFEDEDYFGESAALRIEHATQKVKDILVAPEHGWVLQYYCGTGVAHFEGFNLFADFDANEKVLMAGNHRMLRYGQKGLYTESESLYEVLQEDGLVLAFNTWNDVLTPFVDPVSPWPTDAMLTKGEIPKDGAGMEGDHNFVVTSYKDGEIIMRGERHSAEVRLVACDRPWADYIADTEQARNYVTNSGIAAYYVTNSVDTLYFTGLRNGRIRYSERVDDPLRSDSLACVFTPRGFRLEHQNSIGSGARETKFQEFVIAEDSTCLVSEDGQTKVISMWDSYVVSHTALWPLDQTLFTADQQALVGQVQTLLTSISNIFEIESISIGRSTGNNNVLGLVVRFYSNARQSQTNTIGIELKMTLSSFGQMTVTFDDSCAVDGNLTAQTRRAAGLDDVMRQLAATFAGVYTMTPNNYFLPTGCTFTKADGSYTFKLN